MSCILGVYLGGYFGSVTQLSLLTEIATFNSAARELLIVHKLDDTLINTLNSLSQTLTFMFFRIFFYYYMVFFKLVDYAGYRYNSFWNLIP